MSHTDLCIVIRVNGNLPDAVCLAIAKHAEIRASGELRSVYTESLRETHLVLKALGLTSLHREEIYPPLNAVEFA